MGDSPIHAFGDARSAAIFNVPSAADRRRSCAACAGSGQPDAAASASFHAGSTVIGGKIRIGVFLNESSKIVTRISIRRDTSIFSKQRASRPPSRTSRDCYSCMS
jgi:hypothetical protein